MKKTVVPIDIFLEKMYVLDDGGRFQMFPHIRKILKHVFTPGKDGLLPYNMFIYSCRKKSMKSTLASGIASWYMFGGMADINDQLLFASNSLKQSESRSFEMLRTSIMMNDALKDMTPVCDISKIQTFNGTLVKPVALNYASEAGANPSMVFFDELHGFCTSAGRKLYAEVVPSPTRKTQMRVITTYAGYMEESDLLEDLYKKVVREKNRIDSSLPLYVEGNIFAFWSEGGPTEPNEIYFPWHTQKWFQNARDDVGNSHIDYMRLYENRWVPAINPLNMTDWDRCVEAGINLNYKTWPAPDRNIYLAVGIDASVVKDRTAIVSVFRKDGKFFLGPRRTVQPTVENPIQFEKEIEDYIKWLADKYTVLACYTDPTQMVRSIQELQKLGIPIEPFPQTIPNTTKMASNLIELLRYGNLVMYPDNELKSEALMVSLKEVPGKGSRITKEGKAKKIDSVVALSMALLAAVDGLPDVDMNLTDQIMMLQR